MLKSVRVTYIIAVILLAGWALGFLVFHAGYRIHLVLVLAMMTVLGNIIREG